MFTSRKVSAWALVASLGSLLTGCAAAEDDDPSFDDTATGGVSGTGATVGTGAVAGTGATASSTGGITGTGAVAGTGGVPGAGGVVTTGGTVGTGGVVGTGGTTSGSVQYAFNSSVEGFTISYSPDVSGGTVSHDSGQGDPASGAMKLDLPFNGTDQQIHASIVLPSSQNLTGKTITMRVKLESGLNSSPDNPGGATVFAKSGDGYTWGAGQWTNLSSSDGWVTVQFQVTADGGFNPADVREIGIKLATGSTGSFSSAVVYVDTISY